MKRFKTHRVIQCVTALIALICMVFTIAVPAVAASQEVQDVANGVLKINTHLDLGDYEMSASGTCFLINDDTVLTAAHCIRINPSDIPTVHYFFGRVSEKEIYKRMTYTVSVRGDVEIPATLLGTAYSDDADFAVLKLSQPIGSKKPVKLRDSKTVESADTLYSVGFPAKKESKKLYTADDVSFEQATATKPQYNGEITRYAPMYLFTYLMVQNNLLNSNNINYLANQGIVYNSEDGFFYSTYQVKGDWLMHSGYSVQAGNSGGPIVDENGNAVAICSGGSGAEGAANSCAISQVMEVLDMLNIQYTKAGTSTSEKKDGESTTAAPTTQPTTNDTETASNGLSTGALIGIIAGAVALIAIVVVVIILLNKKKNAGAGESAKAPAGAAAQAQSRAIPSVPNTPPAGSEGTTVLSANASDPNATTVLSGAGSTAYLLRLSNNEKINITKPYFKLGKDASRVDYCVTGNPAISRFHASIVSKNGQFFIVDNSTTNHTYVNDSMIPANVETQISNGAKIKLADERFEFKI
ncbi:MAG: trypsin-like peptidase domain-containing protein [Clostridia bacterium]|nr:trypsin-like peptidase domain-containing protein [Clostridia bacterium]